MHRVRRVQALKFDVAKERPDDQILRCCLQQQLRLKERVRPSFLTQRRHWGLIH